MLPDSHSQQQITTGDAWTVHIHHFKKLTIFYIYLYFQGRKLFYLHSTTVRPNTYPESQANDDKTDLEY